METSELIKALNQPDLNNIILIHGYGNIEIIDLAS